MRYFCCFFFVLLFIAGCSYKDPRLNPSSEILKVDKQNITFDEYIEKNIQHIRRNKVFFNEANKEQEIFSVSPFGLDGRGNCTPKANKGILMVHGFQASPYVMQDIAKFFYSKCFLVRAILLPGHGTKVADLSNITYKQWQDEVHYGLNSLKSDGIEDIYIAGHSLGGALSINAALNRDDIKAAFLIAYLVDINNPFAFLSPYLKYFMNYLGKQPQDSFAHYKIDNINGVSEVYKLTQLNYKLLKKRSLKVPIFGMYADVDTTVKFDSAYDLFIKSAKNPKSKLLIYTTNKADDKSQETQDKRVIYLNGAYEKDNILDQTHLSLHISPSNKYYGKNGSYRYCLAHKGGKYVSECRSKANNIQGEITSENLKRYPYMNRLTYNPYFENLKEHMSDFLDDLR